MKCREDLNSPKRMFVDGNDTFIALDRGIAFKLEPRTRWGLIPVNFHNPRMS